MIAALIRSPMFYSPITHPDRAKGRRDYVLSRMLKEKFIKAEQYQQAVNAPIVLGTYKEEAPRIGAYFSEEIRQYIENSKDYGVENLYRSGLKVYSTLDLRMQQIVESALQRGLRRFDKRRGFRKPARNLVVRGSGSGDVRDPSWSNEPYATDQALSRGRAWTSTKDKLTVRLHRDRDRARDRQRVPGRSRRRWRGRSSAATSSTSPRQEDAKTKAQQVGARSDAERAGRRRWCSTSRRARSARSSAATTSRCRSSIAPCSRGGRPVRRFKPFVYGAAFEKGLTPADTLFDAPIAIPVGNQIYAPKNYYGKYAGIVTIQRALELSINVPAVKTYMMVGGDRVVDFARRCGITSDLPQYPSLALGAAGVSPLEMTAAYNVFANQGVLRQTALHSPDRRSDRARARREAALSCRRRRSRRSRSSWRYMMQR